MQRPTAIMSLEIFSLLLCWLRTIMATQETCSAGDSRQGMVNLAPLCITDPPLDTQLDLALIECSQRCLKRPGCRDFNWFSDTAQCQLFFGSPCSLTAVAGCTHYQISGGVSTCRRVTSATALDSKIPTGCCRQLRNAALNQPAFQVCDWDSSYTANIAVDGNRNPGSCSHTCVHDNTGGFVPWWAVDLGQSMDVVAVNITTRNMFPERDQDLHIGVSDTDPRVVSPGLGGVPLCAIAAGQMPVSTTVPVVCSSGIVRGRYVIIWNPTMITLDDFAVQLCEVEVFVC